LGCGNALEYKEYFKLFSPGTGAADVSLGLVTEKQQKIKDLQEEINSLQVEFNKALEKSINLDKVTSDPTAGGDGKTKAAKKSLEQITNLQTKALISEERLRAEQEKKFLKTEEEKPLEITVGEGIIPKSLEDALINMKSGESKTMTLEPIEAFGPRIQDLIIELPKDGFGSEACLELGSKVSINSTEGKKFFGIIMEIKDEIITVDFNHPLAGKSLVCTVKVVSIVME